MLPMHVGSLVICTSQPVLFCSEHNLRKAEKVSKGKGKQREGTPVILTVVNVEETIDFMYWPLCSVHCITIFS